ncbi:hypothetical protein HanRHA438_Chr10g0448361 [Helianthus annuus]|nr:hypothetical protein HanRHA438_Chr10g0448361 [Helianthus annuus]
MTPYGVSLLTPMNLIYTKSHHPSLRNVDLMITKGDLIDMITDLTSINYSS